MSNVRLVTFAGSIYCRLSTFRPPSGALRAKSARVISVDEPGSKAKQSDSKNTTQRFATSPFRPIPLADSHLSTASSTPKKSTKR